MDLYGLLLAAGTVFLVGFGVWLYVHDRRATLAARLRPQPIRRPDVRDRLVLPPADETRLSVARFRRVVGEWALLEKRAEGLARRADALRRRGLL